jgi:hypothetical protein
MRWRAHLISYQPYFMGGIAMDDKQALQIVAALANGVNPLTGEVFPPDSPYQTPDLIRALYVATRALECRFPPLSSHPALNPVPPSQNPASGNAVKPTAGKLNAGKPWSAEEDRQLLAAFDAGKSLSEIAQLHERTHGGVRARLEKHGRLEPSPTSRWPVGRTPLPTNDSAASR